jgi:hypothetical protein
MAIKGKARSRGRRVVAVAPRQPLYVRRTPLWRRWWVWAVVGAVAAAAIVIGVLVALHGRHERQVKAETLTAVNQWKLVLEQKFPPAPDSRAVPPTGYLIYPTLAADLDKVANGKLSAKDAQAKGKSLAASAKASGDAIEAMDVTKVIPEDASFGQVASVRGPGATRLELLTGRNLILAAFRVYQSIGGLMADAATATGDVRTTIVAHAKDLNTEAQSLFRDGYGRMVSVQQQLEPLPLTPFQGTNGNPGAAP